jgi:hypothetical protein
MFATQQNTGFLRIEALAYFCFPELRTNPLGDILESDLLNL